MIETLALALPTFDGLGKVVVFLLMLSVLVVLHEGGHFLLARLNGVRVNDFAVGFGPTLLKWTSPRSGTNYRINLLPIGGYCAMQGEDGKTSEAEQQREFRESRQAATTYTVAGSSGSVAVLERPRAGLPVAAEPIVANVPATDNFQAKSPLARLSIVVAGPVANFILAYAILFIGAVTFGIASQTMSTVIGPLEPGSPGARAGLQIGDRITAIDGVAYDNGEKLVDKIKASPNVPLRVSFRRHGQVQTVSVTPRADKDNGKTIGRIGFQRIPEFQRVGILAAIPVAASEFYNATAIQIGGYASLISHPAQVGANVSGPIGMARVASAEQDLGWAAYFQFAAIISIALGILNLLPFPALDGGRGVFIIAEMLRGRPVEPEKEALVHVTGFAVLMVLMVFVAYHDIANIVSGKGIL
ncbi:MAG: RIP metalloprotease RseP [Candidatus Eremiobacteraeota bacterium]|nr:RIP metalloprotease RseP [Candidatus Eremiobacteraeota bacterium]